jgi:hypothetical protein
MALGQADLTTRRPPSLGPGGGHAPKCSAANCSPADVKLKKAAGHHAAVIVTR